MKKIYLLFALVFVTTFVGAQTMNYMNVDSVRVRPANPTPADSVFLHVYWNSPWGCSLNGVPTVNNAGLNHAATLCYTVGMITVVTMDHDSVFLFQGPAGIHVVSWQIVQNATFNTQCDWVRDANQQVVNVLSTDIEESETDLPVQFTNNEFMIHANGTLHVYNALGQSFYNAQVNAGQRVPFSAETAQMFTAVFRDESGNTSVLKLISQ
ncbi:MAG: hypothetical protein L6Q81_15830 [Bacteroidia bacterium]|nr:hypothetical protein [Bacteroidia bacterium]